jgi:hypothetical protein
MRNKKRRKKKRKQRVKAKGPDQVVNYGPVRIARYGRLVQFSNLSTPEEHAAFLKEMAVAHKEIILELTKEVALLQALIEKYDPIEIMHRAAYMVLPLFLEYNSGSEYTGKQSDFLPAVEYLQYLISRTPRDINKKELDEHEWNELWNTAMKVFGFTQRYLQTRIPTGTQPTNLDDLRFAFDSQRLLIRVRRYPIYFGDHLRDALSPYEDVIKEAYGIDLVELIRGLEEIDSYQKEGVMGRYLVYLQTHQEISRKLQEHGLSAETDQEKVRETLKTPEFETLHRDVEEKARLAFTPATFDITQTSSLPHSVLAVLSVQPGESVLTTLTGPDHDDLSPLSTSPLHHKPFVHEDGGFYYFYHSGFEDRITEIIENDLFARFPDRAASLRRRRDDHLESVATNLLVSIIKPEVEYRNLFYPDPDEPGGLTELDALLVADDVLFLVEIKAGGFSAAANRGAPKSLFDELSDTIGIGQRQSERAERYIRSADEVPFFNASGKQELCRLKHADFRRVFRIVITREDLGWVGARIAILSMIDPGMSTSFPWHVSLDDLRIVAELFKDSELRFVHFLEERLKASEQIALSQHDEIQHIALYDKVPHYYDLPISRPDHMTFDADYMRDIDLYFAKIYRGEAPALPFKKIHSDVSELLLALRNSRLPGRFEVASMILSMNDIGRNQLRDALKYLDSGPAKGMERSVGLPFAGSACGLTISNTTGDRWDEELIHSAARMEQGRFARWLCVQIEGYVPRAVRQISRIAPGQVSDGDLSRGRAYLEQRVRAASEDRSIKRNDRCPCGSGKKYKRCHGR